MYNVIIALGGNMGDVRNSFDGACAMLHQSFPIIKKSKLYQTAALTHQGAAPQPDYLNAVIHVQSSISPADLLAELHRIEALFGRERKEHWGSRTLDLDLIDYEGCISNSYALMLPHPALNQRLFVLQPLHDVQPHWVHPSTGLHVQDMIDTLRQAGETLHQGKDW
ncbi:MAG: 2-amino-4-hydroxy-6-hydroxymethyldihydropteridine diphosphokinase [Ghiorsea sp.]|nr:2-amino-4-hydroxy-6-hydroxymethyldihydropteridine diphosphokinase [Ghiorsea sp.]MDQ7003519.1 2-amino-4-hydroxy-6-hydroxymethyldihydropteridine diphosphokinase [Ghiorsea sp.]